MTIITKDARDTEFFLNRRYAPTPGDDPLTTRFDDVKDDDADEWADMRRNDPEYTNPDAADAAPFETEDTFDVEFFLAQNVALIDTKTADPDRVSFVLDVPYNLRPLWQVEKTRALEMDRQG